MMPDSAPPKPRAASDGGTEPAPVRRAAPRTPAGRAVARGTLFVAVAFTAWALTRQWLASHPSADALSIHVLVPACVAALVVTLLVGQNRRWRAPRARLKHAVGEIRTGRWPIEALRTDRDGFAALAPLAEDFAALFHEIRRLERRLVEVNHEADLRVATKADALQRVIGSLRLQAIRDPLTGLFNRRALDELLPRLIEHCRGTGEDLSVLMIDVNHFKQLNDQLGHAAGDEMLKNIAQLIRSSLQRSQDAGFRCGGDEFVVVMPGAPALPARALAQRLTSLVANLAKTLRLEPKPGLSVGVATMSELHNPTPAQLMQLADKRLYELKRARPATGASSTADTSTRAA